MYNNNKVEKLNDKIKRSLSKRQIISKLFKASFLFIIALSQSVRSILDD